MPYLRVRWSLNRSSKLWMKKKRIVHYCTLQSIDTQLSSRPLFRLLLQKYNVDLMSQKHLPPLLTLVNTFKSVKQVHCQVATTHYPNGQCLLRLQKDFYS